MLILQKNIIKFSVYLDWSRRDSNFKLVYHEVAHILSMKNNMNLRPLNNKEAHGELFCIEYAKLLELNGFDIPEDREKMRYADYMMDITRKRLDARYNKFR